MYLKIHENPAGRVIAVCDRDLIGKVLEDENTHMDLDRYRDFYVGELAKEDAVKEALGRFGSANLVGERAVGVALSMELAAKEDVMYIKETPYIQIYRL
jgi:hypothetical protein